MQLAVFEAVNAIKGDYEPYLGFIEAPCWASPDAAAIAAAHRTLVTLRPDRAAALDDLRAASLAAIPDGPAKDAGIAVGEDAADAMLLLRANDGWDAVVPYTPGTDPGDWRPELPVFAPAFLPGWGQVTPFGLESGSQFRAAPPPALHTARYARDYNEVMLLGRVDSPFRPQDRTDVARFYAASSPVEVWNSAARQVSAAQGTTLSENARIFALLGMAMGDASIAAYDTKYHYNLWRPLTAIRAGDTRRQQENRRGSGLAPADRHAGVPELRVGPRDSVRRGSTGARTRLRQARPRHHSDDILAAGGGPRLHDLGVRSPTTSTMPASTAASTSASTRRRGPARESTSARTSSRITCVPWMTTSEVVAPTSIVRAIGPHDASIAQAAGGGPYCK